MNASVLTGAGLCIALVAAQYVWPAWAGFHTWQYAAALGLAALPVARRALATGRGAGHSSTRSAVAPAGALVIAFAGIASGLLGPDTQIIARAPGTVAPLPDLAAAAFFPGVDAAALARADARIVLRRKNAADVAVGPAERRYLGAAALSTELQTAAYVAGRDTRGEHLTITQPASAAFLSPILLFPQSVTIAGQALPADAFAVPAAHRQIKAFFFSRAAAQHAHRENVEDAVLFAVDDDAGNPVARGIGFAASGQEVALDGLRLRPTLGRYPALVVSAVPYPAAMWLGALMVAGGLAYGAWAGRFSTTSRSTADFGGRATARPRR